MAEVPEDMTGASSKTSNAFTVLRVESWTDFLRIITEPFYASWIFRGQSDAAWPLLTGLARYLSSVNVPKQNWVAQETRILRVFKRKAHLLLHHVPDEHDSFQWLALMQHHGAPTRLLDFTWSPYVAAFFALERATVDAAIWGINPWASAWGGELSHAAGDGWTWQDVDLRKPGAFETRYQPGSKEFVWVGNPFLMNQRLIAQSGTFAVPSVVTRSLEQVAAEATASDPALIKLVLPAQLLRKTAMWELFRMNITNATLFPGLDGLARSMAYELEYN